MPPFVSDDSRSLAQRMKRLGMSEADLDETFVRSGGKGGQNVNKVSTCVVLVHRPTGTSVKCDAERTQARNRVRAREMLTEKLERRLEAERRAVAARAAKLRRQKKTRSRRAKEEILRDKRARSKIKAARASVRSVPRDD